MTNRVVTKYVSIVVTHFSLESNDLRYTKGPMKNDTPRTPNIDPIVTCFTKGIGSIQIEGISSNETKINENPMPKQMKAAMLF